METLLIEVRDQKGLALLRDLEALQLIRVLQGRINPTNGVISAGRSPDLDTQHAEKPKAADRFAGKLSTETADQLDKHLQQSRDEWDRI